MEMQEIVFVSIQYSVELPVDNYVEMVDFPVFIDKI